MAVGPDYIDNTQYCWTGSCTNVIATTTDLAVEGNVGIGTTSPLGPLQVYSNSATGLGALVSGTNTGQGTFTDPSTGLTLNSATLAVGSNWATSNGSTYGLLNIFNASGSRFWVGDNGNVGIGNNSPARKLHVGPGGSNALGTPTQILVSAASGTSAAFAAYEPSTGAEAFLGAQSVSPQVFMGAYSNHPLI